MSIEHVCLNDSLESPEGLNMPGMPGLSTRLVSGLEAQFHSDSQQQFTQIRFEVVNRKNFRLTPEYVNQSVIPIVLVGNKRRACNYINHLNDCSAAYRAKLQLRKGQLIPFKMVEADSFPDFSMTCLNGRKIHLLCIYSEVFDQTVERKIRNKLENLNLNCNNGSNHTDQRKKFIKTVSTIYLKNGNTHLKITRVKHRRNVVEQKLNTFKIKMKAYSEHPSIEWEDIINLKTAVSIPHSKMNNCTICANSIQPEHMVAFPCGHCSCLECAGSIVTISRSCPFCRAKLLLSQLILYISYTPSLFSSIREILQDIIPKETLDGQTVIYMQTEVAIQHLYNYLCQNINDIEEQLEILSDTIQFTNMKKQKHLYFLACSNEYTYRLPNLVTIVTSTDDSICKDLMLNYQSYGENYGKANQELIVFNAD
jgi:C3HC4-type zinc finger (RING finger) protein